MFYFYPPIQSHLMFLLLGKWKDLIPKESSSSCDSHQRILTRYFLEDKNKVHNIIWKLELSQAYFLVFLRDFCASKSFKYRIIHNLSLEDATRKKHFCDYHFYAVTQHSIDNTRNVFFLKTVAIDLFIPMSPG